MQVSTRSAVAVLYGNVSVLENQSFLFCKQTLLKVGLLPELDLDDEYKELRVDVMLNAINECILKTDMSHHFKLLDMIVMMGQDVSQHASATSSVTGSDSGWLTTPHKRSGDARSSTSRDLMAMGSPKSQRASPRMSRTSRASVASNQRAPSMNRAREQLSMINLSQRPSKEPIVQKSDSSTRLDLPGPLSLLSEGSVSEGSVSEPNTFKFPPHQQQQQLQAFTVSPRMSRDRRESRMSRDISDARARERIVRNSRSLVRGTASQAVTDGGSSSGSLSLPTIAVSGSPANRINILVIILHAAGTLFKVDISNPARPFRICEKWALLIAEEFNLQAHDEIRLGVETPMAILDIAASQIGFCGIIAMPFFDSLNVLFPRILNMVDILRDNTWRWENYADESRVLGSDGYLATSMIKLENLKEMSSSTSSFRQSLSRISDDIPVTISLPAGSLVIPDQVSAYILSLENVSGVDHVSMSSGIRRLSLMNSSTAQTTRPSVVGAKHDALEIVQELESGADLVMS